ncbi:Protein-glutamate methylesterase/protein-glutamine glutaminase [Streptomyces cyaneofuscatus]
MDNTPLAPPHALAPAAARGRVLVVDDDLTVAEVVVGYLHRAGFAVERAGDGPAALERFAAARPDLVVLDLMLPAMDGFEVCRRMRAHGPVPVIMLTARGDEEDRILGLETGADDYVTKPFSPRELVLRVESVLRRAGAGAPAAEGALAAVGRRAAAGPGGPQRVPRRRGTRPDTAGVRPARLPSPASWPGVRPGRS